MSWSAILKHAPISAEQVGHDAFTFAPEVYDDQPGWAKEQIDTAVDAARLLAESGALGDDDARFHVALYGHANRNHHQPQAGPCDTVSITVAQWPAKAGHGL